MTKTTGLLFSSIFIFISALAVNAQDEWNFGDQIDVAKEKNALYTDLLKNKDYVEAIDALNWLLINTPDLHVSIYQNGAKIYDNLAKAEKDPVKKDEYVQKGLEIHDARIKYFQEEGSVTDRKATFAYRYYNSNKEKYPYLYELFTKSFSLNGDKMNSGNLVAYMNVVYKYSKFEGGGLSDEQIIDIYTNISDALSAQRERVKDDRKEKIDKMIDQVDKLLTATVDVDCNFVETKLGPKLDVTGDEKLAKKIFHLLLTGKCTESPLALKAASIIQQQEPTYGVAKFIAQKSAMDGNTDVAVRSFEDAARLTDENTEKAEVYVSIAKIQNGKGLKAAARNSSRRALSFDPSYSEAYKLIGDLYMASFNDCRGGESKVIDRSVFIAAYNQYKKAGYLAGMTNAKNQFPSIEEIFNENYEEGQSVTVGCWINTTVTIERRSATN